MESGGVLKRFREHTGSVTLSESTRPFPSHDRQGVFSARIPETFNYPGFVPIGIQTMISLSPGEIRRRSAGSLVATACPALSAQTTTWASTISAVPVRARTMPTAVESGPSRATRSVPACRINRDRRACLAGLRMACASAVAGIVIRMPRSLACARMASTGDHSDRLRLAHQRQR